MRALLLVVLGGAIAAVGAWLIVSLMNEMTAGSDRPPQTATSHIAEGRADAESSMTPQELRDQSADIQTNGEAEFAVTFEGAAINARGLAESQEGTQPPVNQLGRDELTSPANEPPAPLHLLDIPETLGPFRAAFIREPTEDNEFPDIRLSDATWSTTHIGDGLIAKVNIEARDESHQARIGITSISEARERFILSIQIDDSEFFPSDADTQVFGISARGRDERTYRLPIDILPFETPTTIDVTLIRDEFVAVTGHAQWLDILFHRSEQEYTISLFIHRDIHRIFQSI